MSRQAVLLILVALLGVAAGLTVSWKLSQQGVPPRQAGPDSESIIGEPAPPFTLGSATGERVSASDFQGQVLLVNFWATWCAPCVEEMPMLEALQSEYAGQGLQVLGIALDDVQQARDFAAGLGITYPVLVGAGDVMLTARQWGNSSGQLPYTVLVDRDGNVRWARLGILKREILLDELLRWL
jgi:peroxiredoxin